MILASYDLFSGGACTSNILYIFCQNNVCKVCDLTVKPAYAFTSLTD